uniref:SET domain-containing protein n=1 Tax=Dunaliella tertiolecta TaxID=3047 RepID=A0A7S3R8Z4_DUNTE
MKKVTKLMHSQLDHGWYRSSNVCAPKFMNTRELVFPRTAPAQRVRLRAHCVNGLSNLSTWIESKGGSVNKNLKLEDEAPCGARGVVVCAPGISLADLEQAPLITLPYSLYFDTSKAAALLAQALATTQANTPHPHPSTSTSNRKTHPSPSASAALHREALEQRLSSVQILGLAIALERQQGTKSSWYAYISSLPETPSCPWLLPEHTEAVARAVADALHGDVSRVQPKGGLDDVARAAAAAAATAAVAVTAAGPAATSDPTHISSQAVAVAAAAAAAKATAAASTRNSRVGEQLKLSANIAVKDGAHVPGSLLGSTPSSADTPTAAAAAAAVVARDGVRAAAAAALALAGDTTGEAPAPTLVVPVSADIGTAAKQGRPTHLHGDHVFGQELDPPTKTVQLGAQQQQQQQGQQVLGPPTHIATSMQQLPHSDQSLPQSVPLPHPDQSMWEAAVGAARAEHEAACQDALDVCGAQLGLGLEDMRWGLGQVISRSLMSGNVCGLVPLIDLLNHHPEARPPMLQLDDNDQLVMTVTSLHGNEVVPLEPRQEVYIDYTGGGLAVCCLHISTSSHRG